MGRRYSPFDFEQPLGPRPEFHVPRPPRRFWVGAAFVLAALGVLFLSGPAIYLLTERQWYDGLGLGAVFVTRIGLQTELVVGGTLLASAFALVNLGIALRSRRGGALRAVGVSRRFVRTSLGLAATAAGLLTGLLFGAGLGRQWQDLALFSNYHASGVSEPALGMDVSFYLLQLPFLHDLANWALGVLFMTLILVAFLYTWQGEGFDFHPSRGLLGHGSVLLALLILDLGAQAWLGRYDVLSENRGNVFGAGYSEVNGLLPMMAVQAGLAVLLAVLLIANARLRRLAPVLVAVGGWAVMALITSIVPSVIETVAVRPNQYALEKPYIEREISYTRRAFALDSFGNRTFAGDAPLTQQQIADDAPTIDNLRLWDYRPLLDTYNQLQSIRTYYQFHNVGLDRYNIDGRTQQLEISARELQPSRLPANWVNQKLSYTHGYGVAASPVSAVAAGGLPAYVASDIPTTGSLKVSSPDIYFGETTTDYVIAHSQTQEFDYPSGSDNAFTTYTGTHGVSMTASNRALWALRTGDFNLLVSSQVTPESQLLFRRSITDRVGQVAPFLRLDSDPYIVVVDGRLYWILDAYTESSRYPYSQTESGSGDNYIRNPVKVVVDAYEGTLNLYVVDSADPIIQAWRGVFPTLFTDGSLMPAGLAAHVRVPEGLFDVQAASYRTYHMTDPQVFYNREDVWEFPVEQSGPDSGRPLQPYYVQMRLPGESQAEYLLIQPFTARGKQNMVAWVAARNDAPHYGEKVAFVLPKDKAVFGPQQVASFINQTPAISSDQTLLNQQGSQFLFGNLLAVPIGNTFLYFQPVYLRANNQGAGVPELKKVILVHADQVAYADTLKDAIAQLVGGSATTVPGGGQGSPGQGAPGPSPNPSPAGTIAQQVQALAAQAVQHYDAAQAALRAGDLAGYAREMAIVDGLLKQIVALTGPAPSPAPSPRSTP